MFITFEGGEGVGKSTQVAMLMEYLEKSGQEAILVRQPGGTKICEAIRDIILSTNNSEMCAECEALLYAAARAQLMREVIKPAIKKGVIVVCDRHLDSSLAYQGFARGLGVDQVQEINKMAIGETEPDVTIFLDLPHDKMFRPKEKSKNMNDRLETESEAFHDKVYEGFRQLAKQYANRIVRIEPQTEKKQTSAAIIEALRSRGAIK